LELVRLHELQTREIPVSRGINPPVRRQVPFFLSPRFVPVDAGRVGGKASMGCGICQNGMRAENETGAREHETTHSKPY